MKAVTHSFIVLDSEQTMSNGKQFPIFLDQIKMLSDSTAASFKEVEGKSSILYMIHEQKLFYL